MQYSSEEEDEEPIISRPNPPMRVLEELLEKR
jgi:hypothetical protein